MAFYPNGGSAVAAPLNLRATGINPVFGAGTTGDTVNRVELDADGFIRFGSGSGATDTFVGRSSASVAQCSPLIVQGGLTVANSGSVGVNTAGQGFAVRETGGNAKQGTAVLVAGTVTVANTSVTANSRIFLTGQVLGGTAGGLNVTSRVAGTSFTVTSTNAADTSTFAYEIFEQA